MRKINLIIIHCSATKEGADFNAADILRWHLQRGFRDIGYHYIVRLDGTIETGRPLEEVGAHCSGYNAHSIGVCYVGGLDKDGKAKDTRTPAQKAALVSLLKKLKAQFPKATIHGHREYANKACPCFNAYAEYKSV